MTLGRSVLITGATGSFGQAFVADLLRRGDVERICCLSRDELKQSVMADRFGHDPRLRFFLGDVRERDRLEMAFHGIATVIHAAALKRVDASAYDPEEVRKTNIDGTTNVIRAAITEGVPRVVVLSSDKAVRATNFYGASKFMAEQIAVSANAYAVPRGVRIACTRYGNVLGSRGSVLGVWRDHIANGRPLPLTNPAASRFWMSLADAVALVRLAVDRMQGGEVFIPKLPALTIRALASQVAGPDYPIRLTGLRPGGEKTHEELISPEEAARTHDMGDVYVVAPHLASWRATLPDYGPLVPAEFVYRSDTTGAPSVERLREMLEAA